MAAGFRGGQIPPGGMHGEVARTISRAAALAGGFALGRQWAEAGFDLPDGPVALWVVALDGSHIPLGAGPVEARPVWLWAAGKVGLDLGPVEVSVMRSGWLEGACLVAVAAGRFVPLTEVALEVREQPVEPGFRLLLDWTRCWIEWIRPGP